MDEKALLVIIDEKRKSTWPVEDVRDELKELVIACQVEPLNSIVCRMDKPSPAFLIGSGKVEEIVHFCQAIPVDVVIFSCDLKGSQQRNLEKAVNAKVIDRTQLILDIFARRATSNEGKMQVELAQLEYLLPRLVGKGVELSRLGGGIGTLGPGETKLETDRRRILSRIDKLKNALKDVGLDRALKRKKRKDQQIPLISLVGYTNAGKSTLLNTLTQAAQRTQDGLFTTLDSLSRQMILPNNQKIIVSDTVGFMHDLPHHLIESFKATLEEVREADILLNVLDVSHPHFRSFQESVCSVLKELEVSETPIITVFNKIDKLEDLSVLEDLQEDFDSSVAISALTGANLPLLLEKISAFLEPNLVDIAVKIPIDRMDLVNMLHTQGKVHSIKYFSKHIRILATIPLQMDRKFYLDFHA